MLQTTLKDGKAHWTFEKQEKFVKDGYDFIQIKEHGENPPFEECLHLLDEILEDIKLPNIKESPEYLYYSIPYTPEKALDKS